MRLPLSIVMLTLVVAAGPAQAQQLCPCVPISHEWIVTACDTWNCAVSAMVTAEGSPDVLAMPSGSDDFKWVVLRRVVAGSGFVAPDSPFKLEAFPTLTEATARFVTIEDGLKPMLLTAPDGNVVIVMRSQARRHAAAGH